MHSGETAIINSISGFLSVVNAQLSYAPLIFISVDLFMLAA